MRIDFITLFPALLAGPLTESIIGRACREGRVNVGCTDFREFTADRHRSVDDSPYGGGAGMVLKPEPLAAAVAKLRTPQSRVILLSAQGRPFNQRLAETFAKETHLVFVCGHYEGVDERVRQTLVDDEVSIGGFVLTNGTLAAMVVADAVIRLLPGVLGSAESAARESFGEEGLLEYPQFTRPETWRGHTVPPILRSGDHGAIGRWRREQQWLRTLATRPDLIDNAWKETNS
ncbi:MAG: tRNA (guanosine(37)-N1)-methyltransferase TrmD [Lentisphaeria bacterium]|jgi:tRNA (guanine37-N1)-methyltransferase